jgi:hypothetical protein
MKISQVRLRSLRDGIALQYDEAEKRYVATGDAEAFTAGYRALLVEANDLLKLCRVVNLSEAKRAKLMAPINRRIINAAEKLGLME